MVQWEFLPGEGYDQLDSCRMPVCTWHNTLLFHDLILYMSSQFGYIVRLIYIHSHTLVHIGTFLHIV